MMSHPPHLLFAPGKPWKRKSPAYHRMHDQLRADCTMSSPPSLKARSPKQRRHFAKDELFRLYGETP